MSVQIFFLMKIGRLVTSQSSSMFLTPWLSMRRIVEVRPFRSDCTRPRNRKILWILSKFRELIVWLEIVIDKQTFLANKLKKNSFVIFVFLRRQKTKIEIKFPSLDSLICNIWIPGILFQYLIFLISKPPGSKRLPPERN